MTITGTVVNGLIVPDEGMSLPEGTRCSIAMVEDEFDPATLPRDHPMAPFDPEYDLALIRESIASGEKGVPIRQVFEQLGHKYGLDPLPQA